MRACPASSIARSVDPEKLGEAMYRHVAIAKVRSRCRDRRGSHRLPGILIRPRQSKRIPKMEDEETPEEATLVALPREVLAHEECHGVGAEDTHRSDAIR